MASRVLVCLSASDTWYGKMIRKVTGSPVNHAFIAYESGRWGGWNAVQIDQRGVVGVPIESVKYDYLECYEFKNIDLNTAFVPSRTLVGDAYDWLGILGFLLKILVWRVLGKRIFNPLHKKGDLFCSEFVVTFLQKAHAVYSWVLDLDPDSVAPGGKDLGTPSLRQELKKHSDTVHEVPCPF